MKSSSIRAAMRDLTFGSEVRKASDKPSDNGPNPVWSPLSPTRV
jgi:hypothetical protein